MSRSNRQVGNTAWPFWAAVAVLLAGAVQAAPPVARDMAWGETLFYYFQQDYIPAITRLEVARSRGELDFHRDEAELVLGGMMLGYGLHRRAEAVFESLLATHPKPAVRAQAWYFLAQVRFAQGFPDEALAALSKVDAILPDPLQAERVDLEARALLATGRPEEASRLLAGGDLAGGWRYYGWFNQGIALSLAGQTAAGDAVLDRLGTARLAGPELLALRDRANLSLGYQRMAAGDHALARQAFDRVRLDSPYASRALLGAGWADAARGDYDAALAPWTVLTDRDPGDPAVQEALIAIPYAYAELGATGRAVNRYEYAVARYDNELGRIDSALQTVDAGDAFAWGGSESDTVTDVPPMLREYLVEVMAGDGFQRGVRALDDLQALDRLAARWQSSMAAFEDMLAARRHRFEAFRGPVRAAVDEDRLTTLSDRQTALQEDAARVRSERDVLALADREEREALERIAALTRSGELDAAQAERVRRLRGVILWQASAAFPARVRVMDKSLNETRRALESATGHVGRIQAADVLAPAGFDGFDARIAAAAGRLESLRLRLARAVAAQQEHLERLAVVELQARRQRVSAYLSQARYALAASYDRAALAEAKP